ncbi:phosphohydrolase [Chitinophaga sp. CF418]|uniref:phosphohydrolase n=1 Tax=Chitinophaga sp. CF418 TaxID=1855287 RepID=UPI00090ED250|nr:phosphohydrolase [Chitinophaga sp. CF418]SHL96780.1 hypothetical protein SAMN05216311_101259 [Chitinophaga sp. CF418]
MSTLPIIEEVLEKFATHLAVDREKYRNHVYRVFLNCCLLDTEERNWEIYAIAAVFHDIGIWTDNTIDYLKPSIGQAIKYLGETGREHLQDEIARMIYYHHKLTRYSGPDSVKINTFRKADWIDVSLGAIKFGVDKSLVRRHQKAFANKGFHWFLVKKILRNLIRHPLRPLPMFRR